jgi:hypothetical protein
MQAQKNLFCEPHEIFRKVFALAVHAGLEAQI